MKIPLSTPMMKRDGSSTWTFDMVGTFTNSDLGGGNRNVLINYDYWNEARLSGKDTVHPDHGAHRRNPPRAAGRAGAGHHRAARDLTWRAVERHQLSSAIAAA
jgi:hypothetical protein